MFYNKGALYKIWHIIEDSLCLEFFLATVFFIYYFAVFFFFFWWKKFWFYNFMYKPEVGETNLRVYPNVLPLGCFPRRPATVTAASFAVFVLKAHNRSTWKRRMQICQHMLTFPWTFKGWSLWDTHQCPPPDLLIFREESSLGLLETVTAVLLMRLQNLTLARDGRWQTLSFQFFLDRSWLTYWHNWFIFGRYNCLLTQNNAHKNLQNIFHTHFSFTLMLPPLAVKDLKYLFT